MIIIKKSKIYLVINFTVFSLFALLLYFYHEQFFFGKSLGYIVADSKYYVELSKQLSNVDDFIPIFFGNKNLIGLIVYYKLLNESRILFFILNGLVIFYLLNKFCVSLKHQPYRNYIIFLLLINPVIITSLSGPNKEITGFISILFLISYILEGRLKYFIFSLIFAFFTRFELIAIVIAFIFFRKCTRISQYILFALLTLLISIVIYFYQDYGYKLLNEFQTTRNNSLGLTYLLLELNKFGLYVFTLIPKLMMNFFGEVFTLNFFNLKGHSLFIYISQLLYIYLIFLIVKKKKVTLRNPFFLFILIYSLIFTVPAFIHHRYFLPIYPMLIFLAFYKININIKSKT
jgi:hypothetical protein